MADISADAPAIVWFTRDLRLRDQPALLAAAENGAKVLAVYILDESQDWAPGGAGRWWLHHSLTALGTALRARKLRLVLRRGRASEEIVRLAQQTGASTVHVGHAVAPAARRALDEAEKALASHGCALHRHWTSLVFDPDIIRTGEGKPYGVFTPFANACRKHGLGDAPRAVPKALHPAAAPESDDLQDWELLPKQDWAGGLLDSWTPGEEGGHKALDHFLKTSVNDYATARDLPGEPGTSRLSPHLHWGEISARDVWSKVAASGGGKGQATFISELLWREFCAQLLWHNPTLPERPLRDEFQRMQWRKAPEALRDWQRGRTGIPIVDAGMRQLWQTGWQHNRVRMITASFLIKHLLIDWREGEAWFWDCLVDADLGSNSANWQWVAGCGADAAPFFRVFNPVLQGKKFDPDGAYVRHFVPELGKLADKHIHAPWEAGEEVLNAAGIRLGDDYPRPAVDLKEGRERALAAFAALRS